MNDVRWRQISRTKNIETWVGTQGSNYLLLSSTQNLEIGLGWINGGVRVEEDFNQEGTMANFQCLIFEVAAVEEPTVQAMESGAVSRLVLAPTTVLASERSAAIAIASKSITDKYEPTRTRFIVRQFIGNTAS